MDSAIHPFNNWDLVDFSDGMMFRTTVSSCPILIAYIMFFFIAKGLNLYQKLAPNSFSYVDGYISAINRNVHSLVHERVRRNISFVELILLITEVLINDRPFYSCVLSCLAFE